MSISITWLGHASFKIHGSQNLYIDPWKIKEAKRDADIVLVSHTHNDHYSRTDIDLVLGSAATIAGSEDVIKQEGRGTAIAPGSELSLGGVQCRKAISSKGEWVANTRWTQLKRVKQLLPSVVLQQSHIIGAT